MRVRFISFIEQQWRRWLAALCLSAAIFVTAVLTTRLPAAGTPLSAWWTLATAFMVAGLGASAIASLTLGASVRLRPETRFTLAVACSALTVLSTLATTSQSGAWPLAVACLLWMSATGAFLSWAAIPREKGLQPALEDAGASAESVSFSIPAGAGEPEPEVPAHQAAHGLPDHVDQTVSRYTLAGREHLEACLRVRFEAGQQTAILHLPIQPAMSFDPEVECEPLSGEEVRISVDPAQPYGVRLVCRRNAPAAAGEAIVAVLISSDRMVRAAA